MQFEKYLFINEHGMPWTVFDRHHAVSSFQGPAAHQNARTVGSSHRMFRHASSCVRCTVTVVRVEAARNIVVVHSDSLLCEVGPILRQPNLG